MLKFLKKGMQGFSMSEWDGNERRATNDQITGLKKVIIGIAIGLIVHFVVGIMGAAWYGGVFTTKLEYLAASLKELKGDINRDRYTATEAVKDLGALAYRIDSNTKRITVLERDGREDNRRGN